MKKVLLMAVFAIFGLTVSNAQESIGTKDEIIEKAKKGGFYIGANIGVPLSGAGDLASFNLGADIAYLFGLITDLQVGALIGYSHFIGDGTYNGDYGQRNYDDNGFVLIAISGRYFFADGKFFAGADLGGAINVSGVGSSGFYGKGKFGYKLGVVSLIGSFSAITGGVNYNNGNYASVSGFHTANVGVEFGF